jgi:uncharacterized protein
MAKMVHLQVSSLLHLKRPLSKPEELLFASCRQHNVDLLHEALSHLKSPQAIGEFINTSRDPLGNTALHIASSRGSLDCLDVLLDQEGVEVDPRNRMEGDTPLHCAARLSTEDGADEEAKAVVEMLLEAGADPRFVCPLGVANYGAEYGIKET